MADNGAGKRRKNANQSHRQTHNNKNKTNISSRIFKNKSESLAFLCVEHAPQSFPNRGARADRALKSDVIIGRRAQRLPAVVRWMALFLSISLE